MTLYDAKKILSACNISDASPSPGEINEAIVIVLKELGQENTLKRASLYRELESLKERRFYEEMADFINWDVYKKLASRTNEIEYELGGVEK